MKVLIAIAAAGAAATLALAPTTSQARSLHEQHGASRGLSYSSAAAVAIQPDGKIVAGGQRDGLGSTRDPAESSDFALARYKPNGRLDPSFGTGGRVLTDFGLSFDELDALVLQPDGKIVAGGRSSPPNHASGTGFALARYNSRGRLDPSFGRHGRVRIRLGPSGSAANAIALQPDGKIIAAGTNSGNEVTPQSWVVARFNPDGSLDPSFGNGGDVTTAFGLTSSVGAVTLEPNGKVVVLGSSCGDRDPCELALARYNADGNLDPSFGSGGRVTTRFTGFYDVFGNGVAVQAEGKIIAAGTAGSSPDNYNFILARYNADGSLDSGFGTGGTVMTDLEPGSDESRDSASGLALEPDGAIIVAGTDSNEDFAVALYDAHGSLDPSFGGTGIVRTDLSSGEAHAWAVAIARDGKIVTAGRSNDRFALVRYRRDGGLDQEFGKAGSVTTAFGSPVTIVASFTAADKDRGDLIQWRTAVEVKARGFNVYRERKGHRVRATSRLVPSRGTSAHGASYSFFDNAGPRHGELRYWLQVVKQDGRRVWYGVVVPKR